MMTTNLKTLNRSQKVGLSDGTRKERERISLTNLDTRKYRAVIPETWGERVILFFVGDYSKTAPNLIEMGVEITNVLDDGLRRSSRFDEWMLQLENNETVEQALEERVNRYYNNNLWVLRALRASC